MDKFERYVGVVFDNRYKIDKIIGVGGMAVVYKAIDLLMKRIVAVKMLRDEIAAKPSLCYPSPTSSIFTTFPYGTT